MRRAGLILLPLVVLLLAGLSLGLVLAQRRLDPETLRRAVIASVERQSGRTVSLGRIELRLLPAPHVRAQDFAIADSPGAGAAGAATPDLLRIGRLSAGIGIWPLLRHVVRLDGLRLDDVVLHAVRQADGHGNWEMAPKPSGGQGAGAGGGGARWGVVFDAVRIGSARLSWHDRLRHQGADLRLTSLDGSGLQGERPQLRLSGEGAGEGAAFTVAGEVGPIRRLLATADRRTSWPISLRGAETVDGVVVGRMQAQGTVADPLRGRGYDLVVSASIARLSALNRLFPHAGLPEIDGLEGSAHLLDQGRPVIASLRARAGRTLVAIRGLTVRGWSVSADSPAAPLRVAGFGAWRGQTLVLKGTAASLASLEAMLPGAAPRPPVPVPVSFDLGAGRTAWHVEGAAGVGLSDLRLRGAIPDLRDLVARAPEVGPLTLGARLQTDHGTSFRLTELQLASGAGDLAGALTLSLRRRPELSGTLQGSHIDLDRLMRPGAASPSPAPRPPAAGSTAPASPADAPDAGAGVRPAPNSLPGALPWPLLRLADADLTLLASDVTLAGTQYRSLELHAVLRDGRLAVAPLRAIGPAGMVDARLNADASSTPPTLDLWMRPLMLPASVLTTWLGTDAVRGTAELVGEVRGEGDDAAALSRTAQGHLGISMVDAAVSSATLSRLIGRPTEIATAMSRAGETAVRCIALHAALGGGEAALDTLSLRTGRLSVDGHGRVALADGALDLHLLPDAQLGGARVSMPMRLTGSLHDPHPALDSAASGGRYALQIGPAGAGEAECDGSLRAAREGLAGPAPAAAVPQDAAGAKRKAPKPIDILRGLGILR